MTQDKREYNRRYYLEHKEEIAEKDRQRYLRHKEERLLKQRSITEGRRAKNRTRQQMTADLIAWHQEWLRRKKA